MKEGTYGDIWKVNIPLGKEDTQDFTDEAEIENVKWHQVKTTGKGPTRLAHHAGVL